ncbi:MAG: tocopherol cyclase family protein [Blastocatellia bacterium]
MVVSLKPIPNAAPNFSDNLCRWDGRSTNHYEAWFLTLNHRASGRGFWFRYALESPSGSEPRAALWAAVFNRRDPESNVGLRREYAIEQFAFEGREDFSLKISDGLFTASRATGRVDSEGHSIAWDLSFTPNLKTYHHVTRAINQLARPSSFVCSPNLDTRYRGTIIVGGEELALEEEPGCQSHLWGRKHANEWVWVHSNAFENHPGTVFEGLAAGQRRARRAFPPIQSLYLRHHGEEHRFLRLRLADQWQHKLGIGYWSFSAMNRSVYIEGSAQCRLRDMLQVEYKDPDGDRLYCVNSEVASMKIRLFRRTHGLRWRHVETIKASNTAHLEHACRAIDPHVRKTF